ncbi:uncharacterized protein si:dkey-220k22.3 [Megalops cyprinoides]|uniref:uncharacterized protein si:dkey-220k22.3 n=1 Tax=Megalops cyprinoides TaxID=118141 RepID=UPI001863C3E5|nr:uncharacterized protein si:dkey-220k22.3 [Megalops cyprinoides]
MVHETTVNRAQLLVTGMALAAVVLTIGMFLSKKDCGCHNSCTNRSRELNDTTMSAFFRAPVSKASMFLSAYKNENDEHQSSEGSLMWTSDPENPSEGLSLSPNRTWISVKERGLYLLFVQATFKVTTTTTTNLMLRVDVQYEERTDMFSAIFKTYCGSQACVEEQSDVVLSKPILLRMHPGDNLTVVTSHRELVDYTRYPIPTFLTLFKYSD